MIYFITTRKHDITDTKSIKVVPTIEESKLLNFMNDNQLIPLDTEFSSSVFYEGVLLLMSIGNKKVQWVIDCTCISIDFLKAYEDTKTFVCHNAQAEYHILYPLGFRLKKFWDTMVVEQRLTAGVRAASAALDATWKRRLQNVEGGGNMLNTLLSISKSKRKEFTGATKDFIFDDSHIKYSAGDVIAALDIVVEQRRLINKYNMKFLIKEIEFPLIPIIAEAAIKGIRLDEENWKKILQRSKRNKYWCELLLDREVKRLANNNPAFVGGVFGRKRVKQQTVEQLGLFGVPTNVAKTKSTGNINYSSQKMVLDIFRKLDVPLPTLEVNEKGDWVTKESIKKEALEQYLIEYPNTKLKRFINILLDYKVYDKRISSFGEKFLYNRYVENKKSNVGYKNKYTNRVHTIFKQCSTNNGRFSSGDTKSGKFNIQQTPRYKPYRGCFLGDEGYYVTTADLSGAELVIICAKAKDHVMLEKGIKNDDLHSPLAQEAWRKIYQYKAQNTTVEERRKEYQEKSKTLVVSKKENKELRQNGKNVNFGIIYGARGGKVAKTMNIPKAEGDIVVKNHYDMIPNAMALTDGFADFAIRNGFIIHNTRTYSRRWFPQALYGKTSLSRGVKIAIENEARNSPISGTQADMIKESIVEIQKYIDNNNIDARLLMTIHDELVYQHKDKEFHDVIKRIMVETANKYLEGFVEMGVEAHLGNSWTK